MGNQGVPVTRTVKYINAAFTLPLRSFTQARKALSARRRSDAEPPHQYAMSCSIQHSVHLPSGQIVHPSVVNAFGGKVARDSSTSHRFVAICRSSCSECADPRSMYGGFSVLREGVQAAQKSKTNTVTTRPTAQVSNEHDVASVTRN
jgi:hypothetical protein